MAKSKVYCVQLDPVWEDKAASIARAQSLIDLARPEPGSMIVLPEMFATGFSMDVAKTREELPCPTVAFIKSVAVQYKSCVIGGMVSVRLDDPCRGENVSLAVDPEGKQLALYSKCFPFITGGEGEKHVAGDSPVVFDWAGFKVAQTVCYDLRFPELYRLCARMGANLITVIASWPSMRERHWTTLLQARAIENQAYVIGVNRCGNDPKNPHAGRSIIVSPLGDILADAGNGQTVVSAEIDPAEVTAWRERFPALTHMRPDIFQKAASTPPA